MNSQDPHELKQRMVAVANRMIELRALSRNNHGNISIRIPGTDESC